MEKFWFEFNEIFKKHGLTAASGGKRISIATYHLRRRRLALELDRLRTGQLLGLENGKAVPERRFKLASPRNLKQKHIQALIVDLIARERSTAYIHNTLSMLRVFATWIGKGGLVPSAEAVILDPRHKRRQQAATRDKSWSGGGINAAEKIREIASSDARVAMVLELMLTFSLRLKEASLLRPHLADQVVYLDIGRGTKGGRHRVHKITTPEEREVLERAKALVEDHTACLIPRELRFKQWQNRVYYVCRKHGISRRLVGASTHGLRHEGLNRLYEQITSAKSPVRGGQPDATDPATDRFARQQVAETAGHSRPRIASAYLGAVVRGHKPAAEQSPPPSTSDASDGNTGLEQLIEALRDPADSNDEISQS